ncbi:hypothetical protein SeKA_B0020 (plasmid) [Salmonella enterica subsp. enterica serovar Kentucky str. CVM29188]|nr:hypothetical protein SeKA_B0020 [Salmonella enterica subsp. enterica serovar Kentucky str. CVM29188]
MSSACMNLNCMFDGAIREKGNSQKGREIPEMKYVYCKAS